MVEHHPDLETFNEIYPDILKLQELAEKHGINDSGRLDQPGLLQRVPLYLLEQQILYGASFLHGRPYTSFVVITEFNLYNPYQLIDDLRRWASSPYAGKIYSPYKQVRFDS